MELSRIGFEIELLAPPARSRRDLAEAIAARTPGATARRVFHVDSWSATPIPVRHHLTPAFEVQAAVGGLLCRLVDDITITDGLDPNQPAPFGWYKIMSDDRRLALLAQRRCRPDASFETCLNPVAALFGVAVEPVGVLRRLADAEGTTVLVAAPLVGDRHRVCEIVTPPVSHDHADRLAHLLDPARELGFVVPTEAAVHLHFDAPPLRSAHAVRNLVRLVAPRLAFLRDLVGTNLRCRRIGPLPPALSELVERADFLDGDWASTQAQLGTVGLHKYMDVNLSNLIRPPQGKDTIEFRLLPATLDADRIVTHARLFQALVNRAVDPQPVPRVDAPVPATPGEAAALLSILAFP